MVDYRDPRNNEGSHRRKYLVEKETASVHRDKEGRWIRRLSPEGAEIGFRDGACSVCTGLPTASLCTQFCPYRERERPRVWLHTRGMNRDGRRCGEIARLCASGWASERKIIIREMNKDEERERENVSAATLDIRRSMLSARNIRYDARISEKGNALENKFLRIFVFFSFFFMLPYIGKNRGGWVLGRFEEERRGIFLVIEFPISILEGRNFLKTDGWDFVVEGTTRFPRNNPSRVFWNADLLKYLYFLLCFLF